MARCPFALWRPLTRDIETKKHKPKPRRDCDKTQIILHTMSGHFMGSRNTFETTGNDSTFMLALDGELHQLMETQKKAVANLTANDRAISIETEDGSPDDAIINRTPWTREQVIVLIKLIKWCAKTHGIPLRRIEKHDGPGIGYHMMFRDRYTTKKSNPWTSHHDKICPGRAREEQFEKIILPELMGHRKLTLESGGPTMIGDDDDPDNLLLGGGSLLDAPGGIGLWGTRTRLLDLPADEYRAAPSTVYTREKNGNLRAPLVLPAATSVRRVSAASNAAGTTKRFVRR